MAYEGKFERGNETRHGEDETRGQGYQNAERGSKVRVAELIDGHEAT